MSAPDWLTARPVAHRGLHDISRGIVENMPAAAEAAVAGNFAIECDIQLTADGEAMVHHDDELGRLTEGSGALLTKTAAELKAVRFKNTAERMMALTDLCDLVAGRVPLVIEVKSHFDGDRRLVTRMAEVLAAYKGPAVGMSFDPEGKLIAKGKLGAGVSIEQGQAAARGCGINLIAQVKAAIGDLDKVVRVVRLGGFINSAPDFLDGPKVLNGASDLMVAAFGDKGRHARTTVGVASLPADAAVEVEGVFEVA